MKDKKLKPLFNANESMQTGLHRKKIVKKFIINVSIKNLPETEKIKMINKISFSVLKNQKELESLTEVLHKRFSLSFPGGKIQIKCKEKTPAGPIQIGYNAGEKFIETI